MGKQKQAVETLLSVCAAAKEEETILFVTDDTSAGVVKLMWDAAERFPNKTIGQMRDRVMHGDEPPKTVAAAMAAADVVFGCTKFSMFHTNARRDAVANGARFVNMADYNPAMFESGGLFADFIEQGKLMDRVSDIIEGETVRVTTGAGTDFIASIKGRRAVRQYGRSLKPGASSSPPDIETALGPVEGTSRGIIVIDGSIPHPRLGVLKGKITLTVINGRITDIEGGEEAKILDEVVRGMDDEYIYHVAELGLGFNNQSTLSNSMLEDEGAMGTAHFGFGNSLAFGGSIASDNHLDMVFYHPTVAVDGRIVMKDGEPVL